ncbi:MAG: hypothetical protein M1818_005992 [Claussenomyces sp. TS43310]|nr:MAG: hypothetical protein M1818_005992 [Claussenomyces sp. TS43310]
MTVPTSSPGPSSPTDHKVFRNKKRTKVRNATFVIPSTREHVRRQVTLRSTAGLDGPIRAGSWESEGSSFLSLSQHLSWSERFKVASHNVEVSAKNSWKWLNSPTGRALFKCSLAYMLGCMGTFLPALSNFLGQQDGKHMVATIIVYFHPARSAGSMMEAALLGLVAFLYAVFISVSSMAVSVLCETQFGLIELGYTIVLVVFCGGGLGFVGWTKQKFGQPLVNVACSLTSLAIITVLTKENAVQTAVFSNDKIVQVMKMVLLGITFTTAVSLLVFPVSARRDLRQSMIDATDAFEDMLTIITGSFLSGSETDLRSTAFRDVASRYKSVSSKLSKNLKEAKMEHYIYGTEKEYKCEVRLVNCMQKLAQSIGGLRSAAMTQFSLLKETSTLGSSTPVNPSRYTIPEIHGASLSSALKNKQENFAVLTAIDEHPDESSDVEDLDFRDGTVRRSSHVSDSTSFLPTVRTPAEIFSRFIIYLGPSIKSLAYTLSQILLELPFGTGPDFKIVINEHFTTSLTDALDLYREARAEALRELYKSKALGKERSQTVEADFEEVAASCGYFSFCLQELGEQMQTYLESLENLKESLESPGRRSWNWLKFWQPSKWSREIATPGSDPETDGLLVQNSPDGPHKDLPDFVNSKTGPDHAFVMQSTGQQSWYSQLFRVLKFLERDDIRFALKVGVGAALWATAAYIPATRPFYGHWRGEWGLLSYMLVCSMTLGASNTTGFARFIGTAIGALLAIIVWLMCQGNPFALAFCGWIVSLGCFYLIVAKGRAPFGRFILLTYNLSALYAYSLSVREGEDDDDEGGVNPIITEIALHRVVAVIGGVLWGLIITRIIWPISARQKFKDGLAIFWLRMGLQWKSDPLTAMLDVDPSKVVKSLQEEAAFQSYVTRLDSLRGAAASEFELRGPFPQASYARIMDSTNKMLDAFHALNAVVQKDVKPSEGESALLQFTADERAQLGARISHLFQEAGSSGSPSSLINFTFANDGASFPRFSPSVLASSLKLEYPINDDLPSTANARDRLLAKIFQFRKRETSAGEDGHGHDGDEDGTDDAHGDSGPSGRPGVDDGVVVTEDEDYALLYAYVLVTGQVAEELQKVKKEIEALFGVLDEELIQLY